MGESEITRPQYGPYSLNLVPLDIILLMRAYGYLNTAFTASIWSLRISHCSCEHLGNSIRPSRPQSGPCGYHIAPASIWVTQYGLHGLSLVPADIMLLLRAYGYVNTVLMASI
ncbi:hypothetical protein HAX54_008792 [Datura stramonium]|uniref:Uncharacterized protein n=1 Tax=Datura stramonium TaxID=4076 RepID=A0ABS8TEL5_DATST|nr:hypothetical protein [Datura stramonium]